MSSEARKGRKTRERGQGPAVMTDVAKLARVSHQTVSRVLHGSPHVRGATRERVLEAIRQLNYRPNLVAQALVTGRSRVIGVVSLDTVHYGPTSTLLNIEEAAYTAGYAISITSLRSRSRDSVLDAVQLLRDQAVDGIVVIAPHIAAVEALRRLPPSLPMVVVGAGATQAVPTVAVDQIGGAMAATQHLLDLGHRTVWHFAGPADWLEAEQRITGWQAALKQAGAPLPPMMRGDWSAHSGYELGRQLLDRPEATAVFVANDQMALGLLRRLHEVNRDAPRQLSIVGFDDIPEAGYFTPPLTTVRQDFAEVGRRCIHLLIGQIEDRTKAREHSLVPIQLILRESTATVQSSPR